MQLSDDNRNSLLLTLHKYIEEYADATATTIFQGKPLKTHFPSNSGLTEAEQKALLQLQGNEPLMTALRKLFASNTGSVLFMFFSMIDGVAEPEIQAEKWSEVLLIDKPGDYDEDVQFLHDELYGTYWDWKDKRGDKGWSLDTPE